jgi:peptidoglycan/xylan/chitin deacetylase (PgdA/CDA1 family)
VSEAATEGKPVRQPTHVTTVPLLRARTARRLAVLTFREVFDRGVFEAQLDRVLRSATPVSVSQVERAMTGGPSLPPHSVLLTFEHGHRSVATEVLPLLAARRVPALAFVVAGLVDSDRPYWWDEAEYLVAQGGWARSLSGRAGGPVVEKLAALPDPDRRRSLAELRVTARHRALSAPQLTSDDLHRLLDAGIAVGSHGLDHARLDRCDEYALREEIVGAHDRLTELTGAATTSASWATAAPSATTACWSTPAAASPTRSASAASASTPAPPAPASTPPSRAGSPAAACAERSRRPDAIARTTTPGAADRGRMPGWIRSCTLPVSCWGRR